MKKMSFLLAIILCLGGILASCSGGTPAVTSTTSGTNQPTTPTPEPDPDPVVTLPPANPDALALPQMSIVKPTGASESFLNATEELRAAYLELSDISLPLVTDGEEANGLELLIGETNRPESAAAKEKLPEGESFAYAIVRTENALAIVGTTDELTLIGIRYFINTVLEENIAESGMLNIEENYLYVGTAASVSLKTSSGYRLIISRSLVDANNAIAKSMGNMLQTVTGKSYRIANDSSGVDDEHNQNPEILVGTTHYPETIRALQGFGYHEYGLAVIGNKLVVIGVTREALSAATDLLESIARKYTVGDSLILPRGMMIKLSLKDSNLDVPVYPAALQAGAPAGEGGTLIRAYKTDAQSFAAYGQTLANAGYTLQSQYNAGENLFFTYYKGNQTLTCNYHPVEQTADIIVDDEQNRPLSAAENQYTAITTTLFTQMGLSYISENAGMGYVMRLADGRFIVIDGGSNSYEEYKHLYSIIAKQHQESGREGIPVIAAWFLTHAHGDHYGNFQKFASLYCPDSVTLESVVWNMGNEITNSGLQSLAKSIRNFFKASMRGVHMYVARTGQKYHIANVTVDVLFTPDDYGFTSIQGDNNTSCYYKITVDNGQTIMITGDSEGRAAGYMSKRYAAGGLEADIMQQAHHGYWAGSVDLYKLINPEVVFWPCPNRWYFALYDDTFDPAWGSLASNKWITVESTKVKQIVLAGNGDYTIALPYTAIDSKPHTTAIKYEDGAVIRHQDFESCGLYNTGLEFAESHHESFNLASLTINAVDGSGKALYLKAGANTGLRLITPDMVRGNEIVTLTMDLDIVSLGNGLSIWYNDADIEDTANASFYSIDKTGRVKLSIEINRAAGTYKVYVDGALYAQGSNASNDAGFICLLLKSSEIYLHEFTLTAGTYEQIP